MQTGLTFVPGHVGTESVSGGLQLFGPALGPLGASRGRHGRRRAPGSGRRVGARGLPPPPAATPPPAPAARARGSVRLSVLSTSVGISSQEVRE